MNEESVDKYLNQQDKDHEEALIGEMTKHMDKDGWIKSYHKPTIYQDYLTWCAPDDGSEIKYGFPCVFPYVEPGKFDGVVYGIVITHYTLLKTPKEPTYEEWENEYYETDGIFGICDECGLVNCTCEHDDYYPF